MVIFIMAFLDAIGTLIGLSMRADLLDENGNLPEIERPMLADALATIAAPLLATSTIGAYTRLGSELISFTYQPCTH